MQSENFLVNALYYLLAAVILVPLFKRLGLGSILGYLCAGLLLGPYALGIVEDPEEVLHFAEYGVMLLLFVIGLELAPDKLWAMRGQIGVLGSSQLLLTAAVLAVVVTLLVGSTLNITLPQAIVIGLTLALSSTAFAIQLMNEEHVLASPLGRNGLAILLLQDLAVIPILILLDVLAQAGGEDTAMPWYWGVIAMLGVLVLGRFGLNRLLALVARTNIRELMTGASLLIVIGVALLMNFMGLSMGLGAFIAGILLANSNYRHQVESDIEPFKGILLGLFFIAIGMTINLDLLLEQPLLLLAAAAALVVIKTLLILGLLYCYKVPLREGLRLGLMLSQGGEFAFVVFTHASESLFLSPEVIEPLTLVVGLSMAMTSPLVALHKRLLLDPGAVRPGTDSRLPRGLSQMEPEVIIAGFGRFGQVVGRMLSARKVPFAAMDKNPTHVEFVQQFGNRLFYGDLTRLDLLKAAGINQAKVLVVAVNDISESLQIIDKAKIQNPAVHIVVRAIDRFHAYELHKRQVDSVIRETFASSIEAAVDTLKSLGYTEGQALVIADMFRKHDESLLLKSVEHKDDIEKLLKMARKGRQELEALFEEDSKNPVSA
ncbi:MAG: monovalent cation:proton antiporter-2 (CPA2) family protein [Pseudohongiellaceae bacterium]